MANMPEVAKATVTIIPTMKGAQAKIASDLGAASGPAGASGGKTLGKSLLSALGKVVSVAAVGSIIKGAISEGAALQQSVGGVETLFKESADRVIENAQRAFETAGVSANAYMEQVTSFSATLLQGLGGDTEKAAAAADKAIIDMADNANKMGTSIEAIQNAYQGFAKDNYTMLDNLKLGYGGTASEMARLVNESGVLGDTVKVTAETVKDVPFDTIIEAIHKTQENLGITGTTALEAATTFSGSLASMKASWANLLGAMGTGGNVKSALAGFGKTAVNFIFDNLLPMLGDALSALPELLLGGDGLIKQFVDKIVELAPEMTDGAAALMQSLVTGLIDLLPSLVEGGFKLATGLATAIVDTFSNTDWMAMLGQILDALVDILPIIAKVAIDGFHSLIDNIVKIFNKVTEIITTPFTKGAEFVKKEIEKIKGFFKFDWGLPKIKLPHFGFSGKFSLNPLQVPKLTVDWYDKGGVFYDPTIIGVGEKRPEFVGALDDLRQIVREESASNIIVNVYPSAGMDEEAFARRTADLIQVQIERRAAAYG